MLTSAIEMFYCYILFELLTAHCIDYYESKYLIRLDNSMQGDSPYIQINSSIYLLM